MANDHLKADKAFRLTDLARLWKMFRRQGARRTWVNARATLFYRMCFFEGRRFDEAYGVETAEPARLKDLVVPETGTIGYEYVATSPSVTRAALKSLPLEVNDYTFIDIGCGKGRVLIVAAELGRFRRVIGVDIAPALVDNARSNLYTCRVKFAPDVTTEVICCDATKYAFPDEGLVLNYFAAPRDDSGVLRSIIEAVHRSHLRSGKGVYLVVVNNYEDLSQTFPYLQRFPVKGVRATLYSSLFSLAIWRFS